MIFNKDDLKYFRYYEWNEKNATPNYQIDLDEEFVKYDGYYTMILINIFAKKHGLNAIKDCHSIEDAIGVCPNKNKSFKEIIHWLEIDFNLTNNYHSNHNKEPY